VRSDQGDRWRLAKPQGCRRARKQPARSFQSDHPKAANRPVEDRDCRLSHNSDLLVSQTVNSIQVELTPWPCVIVYTFSQLGSLTLSTSPPGHTISTLSMIVACPRPKCRRS